jgi:hypothetical protein
VATIIADTPAEQLECTAAKVKVLFAADIARAVADGTTGVSLYVFLKLVAMYGSSDTQDNSVDV